MFIINFIGLFRPLYRFLPYDSPLPGDNWAGESLIDVPRLTRRVFSRQNVNVVDKVDADISTTSIVRDTCRSPHFLLHLYPG